MTDREPDPAEDAVTSSSASRSAAAPTAVVFDLGGVLIDWNPRYLYRKLFGGDDAAMERFLRDVTSGAWNLEQDRGRTFAVAIAELVREHPDEADLIHAWWDRWPEMLGGAIEPTVRVLDDLRQARRARLFALTNWSAETYRHAPPRYPFLGWFEAVVVSGEIGLIKPDPAIFRHLIETYGLEPARTVLVDDLAANVEAAAALGIRAIRFTGADELRRRLAALGLLD